MAQSELQRLIMPVSWKGAVLTERPRGHTGSSITGPGADLMTVDATAPIRFDDGTEGELYVFARDTVIRGKRIDASLTLDGEVAHFSLREGKRPLPRCSWRAYSGTADMGDERLDMSSSQAMQLYRIIDGLM